MSLIYAVMVIYKRHNGLAGLAADSARYYI